VIGQMDQYGVQHVHPGFLIIAVGIGSLAERGASGGTFAHTLVPPPRTPSDRPAACRLGALGSGGRWLWLWVPPAWAFVWPITCHSAKSL
jgi:hypothetical protein